jgi:alpha-glucosidase
MDNVSRRETLSRIGAAALGLTALPSEAADDVTLAGKPVELVLTPASSRTLRVTLLPVTDGRTESIKPDPAIVLASSAAPILRARAAGRLGPVRWGQLQVDVTNSPMAVAIHDAAGKSIQRFVFDEAGAISFRGSAGPLFGLGEGGPQFDRRDHPFTMQNGQVEPGRRVEGARFPTGLRGRLGHLFPSAIREDGSQGQ